MSRKHKIKYYREVVMETFVEAETLEEALRKFHQTEYDSGHVLCDAEINDELISIEECEIEQMILVH